MPRSEIQSGLTLFVLIHFFCVFVAIFSNWSPSALQMRLNQVFRVYTGTLNFDLNFTPYHLTHATEEDVDHHVQYLPAGASADEDSAWQDVAYGLRGSDRRQRYQRWASVLAFFRQDDTITARLARAAAATVIRHDGKSIQQIRARKHFLQPWDRLQSGDPQERNPNSDIYLQTIYSANVLSSDRGEVDIVKIDAPAEVAPPTVRRKRRHGRPVTP